MAMEDHDFERIKRFLPVAQNLGVAPEVWQWPVVRGLLFVLVYMGILELDREGLV